MGLDIMFRLDEALEAGLETKLDVLDYREFGEKEQELTILMKMPNRDYWVTIDTCPQFDGFLFAIVRANEWGKNYSPLTLWLQSNNIKWVGI